MWADGIVTASANGLVFVGNPFLDWVRHVRSDSDDVRDFRTAVALVAVPVTRGIGQ